MDESLGCRPSSRHAPCNAARDMLRQLALIAALGAATYAVLDESADPSDSEEAVEESVTIEGDPEPSSWEWLALARPDDNTHGEGAGAVEVWRRTDSVMAQHIRLMSSQPRPGAHFGLRVALTDRWLAVSESGAVELFELIGEDWEHAGRLPPPRPDNGSFGRGLAFSREGELLVGAYGDAKLGPFAGVVHRYNRDELGNWRHVQQLRPEPSQAEQYFGRSLAVEDLGVRVDGVDQSWLAQEGPEGLTAKPLARGVAVR